MNRIVELLTDHPQIRSYRRLWSCLCLGEAVNSPEQWLDAMLEDLAEPESEQQVFEQLVQAGEFVLARELLSEPGVTPAELEELREHLERAIRQRQEVFSEQVRSWMERARQVGLHRDPTDEIRSELEFRVQSAENQLNRWLDEIRRAEAACAQIIREQANNKASEVGSPALLGWRRQIDDCVSQGDLATAQFLLEKGPDGMLADRVTVARRPPEWSFSEPLESVLSWYRPDAPAPPGFRSKWSPQASDPQGCELLARLTELAEASGLTPEIGLEFARGLHRLIGGDGELAAAKQAADGIEVPFPIPDGRLPVLHVETPVLRLGRDEQGSLRLGLRVADTEAAIAPTYLLRLVAEPAHRKLNFVRELGRLLPLSDAVPAMLPAELDLPTLPRQREFVVSLLDVIHLRPAKAAVERILYYTGGGQRLLWQFLCHLLRVRQERRGELQREELKQVWESGEMQREAFLCLTDGLSTSELVVLGICVFAGDGKSYESFLAADIELLAQEDFQLPEAEDVTAGALHRLAEAGLLRLEGEQYHLPPNGIGALLSSQIEDPVQFVSSMV